MTAAVSLTMLGQAGCRLCFPGTVVYVDPYLSRSVEVLDAPDLTRLLPVPVAPVEVRDATLVLITHDHIDHCDPHTLPDLATASPGARFVGPPPVLERLTTWGIAPSRLVQAAEQWSEAAPGLRLRAVPAAHPVVERDAKGRATCVGYVLEHDGERLYLAGDTSVHPELLDALTSLAPIDVALLPVNERNYFRDRRGLLGNMSIREAFLLAVEIGVRHVVPVHWDMFEANAAYPEEILAIYRRMQPPFTLHLNPRDLPGENL